MDSASTPAASSGAPVFAATSSPVPQRQPQPPGHPAARRGVGGVLRELHDDPVPVPAERVVLLGVGVLAEPARRGRPGVKHPGAQSTRVEGIGVKGIGQSVSHTQTLAHRSPGTGQAKWGLAPCASHQVARRLRPCGGTGT